ncbi:T9SS type A sorting domain-containing protein [Winogradskyella sp. KYW1333]|uniref:T9SS type A sorting domain-containing protein n=1 Tax=Winogradskyella sp. KYW1333 TaxID=2282123 RepID=UPI000DF29E54|nr:T9SS type A sorting domain-containing protein [Winogradskyella sp. KYW1333]RCT54254.1 T9SS C-terminal target domain-containing protein [Winogradskyella sp. KYW1333]
MTIFRNLLQVINIYAFILLFSIFNISSSHSQQPAFPSAYGAAAYSVGASGGVVLHVTSLADGSRDDIGTLRWAIQNEMNKGLDRTIVFDVSGVIELQDWIRCSNLPGDEGGYTGSIYLAGQSAPEGGITVTGNRIIMSGLPSVIVRYMKFRNSGGYSGSLHVGRGDDTIIDHCSFSHVSNSTAVSVASRETGGLSSHTISNNLWGQCSYSLIIGNSSPEGPVQQEDGSYTVIRNAYYNVGWRVPFKGGSAIKVDVVNNLIHNWSNRLIRMDHWDYKLNHIENYYQAGVNTTNKLLWCGYNNNSTSMPQIYNQNNFLQDEPRGNYSVPEGFDTDESVAWTRFQVNFEPLPTDWFLDNSLPFQGREFDILPNSELKNNLLPLVGASQYIKDDGTVGFYRDTYDMEFVNGIDLDAEEPRNSTLNLPIQTINNTRPVNFYNPLKSDHIPEVWYDLNIPDGQTHNDLAPSGYTWIEEYLNQVDGASLGNVEATGIDINPDVVTLNVSEILDLDVQFTPANTTDQNGLWTSENESIATVNSSGTVVGNSEGIVEIRFTSNDGGFTDTSLITVIPVPLNAEAGEDQTICVGDSVTLSASGGTNFLWNNGETTPTIEVSPLESTTYTVTVSDGNQEDTDEVTVFVDAIPNLNISEDVTIVSGETAILTIEGANTYLWSTGETTSNITVSPTETTTYTVSGFNGACEVQSQVTVTIEEIFIASAGGNQSICEGSGEIVTLTAGDGDSYLWSTGETTQSINVSPTSTTTYSVTISSGIQEDSDEVTVFVEAIPNLNISDDVTIVTGESTVLTVEGANTYLWSTGETTSSITVSPNTTETYTVTGTNDVCEVQAQVTVTVEQVFQANAGDDQSICEGSGDEVTLSAGVGDTYLWSTGETTQSIIVNPVSTTTYSVTISSGIQEDSDDVTVFVDAIPNLNISEDVTIVSGESAVLTAEGANTYLWSTGETTSSITVSPNTTETYTVIGTNGVCDVQAQVTVAVEQVFQANAGDDQSICEGSGDEVTLSAGVGDTYLWSTGETTQSIIVNPVSTTTYSVTISSGIQEDSDDVTVFVDPNPNVVIVNGDSVDILNGDFITLSATGANYYEWNNGATQPNIAVSPNATTTYEVRGYINDCYDEKQVTVNVFEPVQAYAGEDISICLNEVATLTATGGDEFLWSTGETTQSIQVSPLITTDYTVTVFNALDFDEATVRVSVQGQCNENTVGPDDETQSGITSFNVYPNPASNYVNIRLKEESNVTDVLVLIYDFAGRIVRQKRIENVNQLLEINSRIDLRTLSSGIYFIKLLTINGSELTKKLIVRNL